jgi:CheY-like chemotaxis protein
MQGAWGVRGGRAHTVLCVDDEAPVLDALRRVLRHEPYDVVTMARAEDALSFVQSHEVSLVVSDERMPGMAGRELLRQVRRRSPATARFLLTGYPEASMVEQSEALGIERLILKPWDDEGLRGAIRDRLRRLELGERPSAEEPAGAGRLEEIDASERDLGQIPIDLDCRDAGVDEMLERVARVLKRPEAPDLGVVVLLRRVLAARESMLGFFQGLLWRAETAAVAVGILDPSGLAGEFLRGVGRPVPLTAYRPVWESPWPQRVLVVEHRPGSARILRALVQAAGHVGDVAVSLHQAVGRLQTARWDRILLDLALPSGGAFELLGILREDGSSVPVAAMCDPAERWDDAVFEAVGVRRRLPKPYRVEQILEALNA